MEPLYVGAAFYVVYYPHCPQFSIINLRTTKMNFTSIDSPSHHTLQLTLITKNPNEHLVFFHYPFTIMASSDFVFFGNGLLSLFESKKNN